jgi:hypothetical protein
MPQNILYIGGDESNNGRIPEIHVAVFSQNYLDIIPGTYRKIRRKDSNWNMDLGPEYKFTFLISPIRRNPSRNPDLIGRIYSSLLNKEVSRNISKLAIYIDGSLYKKEEKHLQSLISYSTNYRSRDISINFGPQLDTTIGLVNNADKIANFLFRKKLSFEELSRDKRFKPLLNF